MRNSPHIKVLYWFILKSFLPLFFMTFLICHFLIVMQSLWLYIDDLVGKGLKLAILAELFFYAAVNLIPLALPLSILLASLMTFGNLGERLELLAIKSSGISLLKSFTPLIVLVSIICVGAFFFQNNISPVVQVRFFTLLTSIQQKPQEIDIPTGVFYDGLDDYSLYVDRRDKKDHMMKDLIIYDMSRGFENTALIVAKSGIIEPSKDKLFINVNLNQGTLYSYLSNNSSFSDDDTESPYARESFKKKTMSIFHDETFKRRDDSYFVKNRATSYISKNVFQLISDIDSMGNVKDSLRVVDRNLTMKLPIFLKESKPSVKEKSKRPSAVHSDENKDDVGEERRQFSAPFVGSEIESYESHDPNRLTPQNFDSIKQSISFRKNLRVLTEAESAIKRDYDSYYYSSFDRLRTNKILNMNWVEFYRKFTLSFACLIFFFIGAPLGSIIRKGGIGTPVVISVIFFIIYWILNNIGYKMARDGIWPPAVGMWFSSFVIFPVGIFLTYKAISDSSLLNSDAYLIVWRRITRLFRTSNSSVDLSFEDILYETDKMNSQIEKWENVSAQKTGQLHANQLFKIYSSALTFSQCISNSSDQRVRDFAKEYRKQIPYPVRVLPSSSVRKILKNKIIFLLFFKFRAEGRVQSIYLLNNRLENISKMNDYTIN